MASNLYDDLGVDRSATRDEIKRAYRRRAKKAHPDAGGSADEFTKLGRAVAVLGDEARRKRYDETGRVDDEPSPDNKMAAATQIIEGHLATIISEFAGTWDRHKDPRHADLINLVVQKIEGELRDIAATVPEHNKLAKFFVDMIARISRKKNAQGPDVLRRSFERNLEGVRATIAQNELATTCRKMAIELLRTYDFRRSPPPMPTPAEQERATMRELGRMLNVPEERLWRG